MKCRSFDHAQLNSLINWPKILARCELLHLYACDDSATLSFPDWGSPLPRSGLWPRFPPCLGHFFYAEVAELVDALASGASGRKAVEVRVLSWAPLVKPKIQKLLVFLGFG